MKKYTMQEALEYADMNGRLWALSKVILEILEASPKPLPIKYVTYPYYDSAPSFSVKFRSGIPWGKRQAISLSVDLVNGDGPYFVEVGLLTRGRDEYKCKNIAKLCEFVNNFTSLYSAVEGQ